MSDVTQEDRDRRFWEMVDIRGVDDCWLWKGSVTSTGYGAFSKWKATHISLTIDGRPRYDNLCALHSCDNPLCVNPKHLRWGSNHENVLDMISKKRHHAQRKTHCKHGHPLSGQNVKLRSNGQRSCVACIKIVADKYTITRRERRTALETKR